MPLTQPKRFEAICQFSLDDDESEFPFSLKLAKEQGWDYGFTLRAMEEYKRFMYLCTVRTKTTSPSVCVDQVWHMHLLYTRSYWDVFCAQVLEKRIHHGPSTGGKISREIHILAYSETLNSYFEEFDEPAPVEFWPKVADYLKYHNFQRVNLHTHKIKPRRKEI